MVAWIAFAASTFASPQPPTTVRVAGVVLKWAPGDKEQNYSRAEPLIREAAAKGAKIVCTTESFLDGYSIRNKQTPLADYVALAEPIPSGPFVRKLAALADELDVYLVAGLLERDGEKCYNAAALFGPDGKLLGKYRKHELGHELVRNTPGSDYPAFDTPFGKVGLMICADRRFSKTMQGLKQSGAELVICPSGGMWGPEKNDHHLVARSKEGHVPIVFVHPIEFLVVSAAGEVLDRSFLGDNMDEGQATKDPRSNGVVRIFDLPLRERPAAKK